MAHLKSFFAFHKKNLEAMPISKNSRLEGNEKYTKKGMDSVSFLHIGGR